jgi:hypothetical protein
MQPDDQQVQLYLQQIEARFSGGRAIGQARRLDLHLPQALAAERCGLALTTWRYLEWGLICPRPATIRKVAAGLEIDLTPFLPAELDPTPPSTPERGHS